MEIVIIEKTAFETLIAGVKALEDRVRTLAEKGGDRRLAEWMETAALPSGWIRRTCAVCCA